MDKISKSEQRLIVVIGIIENQRGEILVAKRPAHKHLGGLWEFPGGKVEVGESLLQALQRELHEEVGIWIHAATPFMQLPQDDIVLHVWHVTDYEGCAYGKEQQPIAWIAKSTLATLDFPPANHLILQHLMAQT